MAEIFESYEDEFRSLASDCQKKLSDLLTYETNPEKKSALLRQATPQGKNRSRHILVGDKAGWFVRECRRVQSRLSCKCAFVSVCPSRVR